VFPLNFGPSPADNAGVDQVSRPMQIALVAVVLLAGMWFTVLKPKPADSPAPTAATPAAAAPVAPGVKGLTSAVDKAKGAAATSDATNAKIQQASGGAAAKPAVGKPAAAKATATPATKPAVAKTAPGKTAAANGTTAAAKANPAATKTAAVKPAAAKAPVDPSQALLAFLAKGKTVVLLFHGDGADDAAARKAVHRVALKDKGVISAYADITKVATYSAITSDINVTTAPTILVIGTDGKVTPLTGYVDAGVVRQAVGDARRNAAAAKK
jgi:hypothetical protein